MLDAGPGTRCEGAGRSAQLASALSALLLAFSLACSGGSEEAPEVSARQPAPSEPSGFERPLPAPGVAIVEYRDGRVHVLANEATRLTILERLAAAVPFELLPGRVEPRTMTVRIDGKSIDDTFEELLAGVRYSVEYDVDPKDGARVLSRLVVGEPVSTSVARPASIAPRSPLPDPKDLDAKEFVAALKEQLAKRSPEERAARDQRVREYAEKAEPELVAQLESYDSLERLDAVEDLPMFGEGAIGRERLDRMASILADDPDRAVRIAAADRLSEAPSPTSKNALIAALQDPEPTVVMAVIEALEDLDDPAAIPDLQPLTQHENEEIAEAAQDAIDWLEP